MAPSGLVGPTSARPELMPIWIAMGLIPVSCVLSCAVRSNSSRAVCTAIPTPRQQGVDEEKTDTGSPRWSWARLLKRVVAVDIARCPLCQEGSLRIIAALTHGEVIRKILRHLKLAADPPPIAPACVRQEAFAWSSA